MNQQSRQNRPPSAPPKRKRRRRGFPWWTLPVIALSIAALWYAWAFANEQLDRSAEFKKMRDAVAGDVFHGPVYLDGVSLRGLTMAQARETVDAGRRATAQSFEVILTSGERRWRISQDEVPMAWDTDALLEKLYMIGRQGSLSQRYREVENLSPVRMESAFSYDRAAVRGLIDTVAAQLTEEPVSATVVAFDVAARSFTFSEERPGRRVDANALYDAVIGYLDAGMYGTVIEVAVDDVPPSVTRAELSANYTRLSSHTTKTTDDRNRNVNIEIAASALNGVMIAPGGVISFNETTGKRTADKGYLKAGAIENGRTIQETAGGVCQVSTTLFNALVRANCAIVERKPHAWPSTYVPRGEDATVDWPSLDLKMKNNSDAPMFVTAWYKDRQVTVEVYGLALENGLSIELVSETTYTNKAKEVVYTYNPNLPVGTTQLLKKPHDGYSVTTYKIWLQNGVEARRDKLYTSEYRMIPEEYEYNDGKPPAGF